MSALLCTDCDRIVRIFRQGGSYDAVARQLFPRRTLARFIVMKHPCWLICWRFDQLTEYRLFYFTIKCFRVYHHHHHHHLFLEFSTARGFFSFASYTYHHHHHHHLFLEFSTARGFSSFASYMIVTLVQIHTYKTDRINTVKTWLKHI